MVTKKSEKKPFYDWVGIDKGYPPEYELVLILFESGHCQPGWWSGQSWDSGKKIGTSNITAWKRVMTHAAV